MEGSLSKKYNQLARQKFADEFSNDGKEQTYTNVVLARPSGFSVLQNDEIDDLYRESYNTKLEIVELNLIDILLEKYKGFKNPYDSSANLRGRSFLVPPGAENSFKEDAFEIFDQLSEPRSSRHDVSYEFIEFYHSGINTRRLDILNNVADLFDANVEAFADRTDEGLSIAKVMVSQDQKYEFWAKFERIADILGVGNPQPGKPANDSGPAL